MALPIPYRGAIKLQRDRCFSEFLTKTGKPTSLLTKAQANLGITPASSTFANLPTGAAPGTEAFVTDGGVGLAWGAPVTGGGTTPYLVAWNGTAWTVIGK